MYVDASKLEPLTPKEHEAMFLLCRGKTGPEIASAMGVSINTVKHHVRNIYAKYGVRNRIHAVERHRAIDRNEAISLA